MADKPDTKKEEGKMMAWLKDCEICNTGLCKAVDELKARGLSENLACEQMSGESDGLYSKEAIKGRYRHHTGKAKRKVCENHTTIKCLMSNEEKNLCELCDQLKRSIKIMRRANLNDSLRFKDTHRIMLKGSKRGFSRSMDDYPGTGTMKELLVWQLYFQCSKLADVAHTIQDCLYSQLPEELPENRPQPKKKKPSKLKKVKR